MLFSKKNKEFWRDKQGNARCAGDNCPVDCDSKCPLWLSTVALEKLQKGDPQGALDYFKRSLAIDSEIPETYNNMAMAYGFSNNHQEAYNAYKKALELRPGYTNALRGIVVAEKNLGLYDAAIAHCDEYKALTGDPLYQLRIDIERLRSTKAVKTDTSSGSGTGSFDPEKDPSSLDAEMVEESGAWELYKIDSRLYFWDSDEEQWARTPGGVILSTAYEELASRILEDLDSFGPEYMGGDSVLPWHYTMVEHFSKMDHAAVEKMLDDSFLKKTDWSLDANVTAGNVRELFGMRDDKRRLIRDWLSKCTIMQMTAACCIGNSFHSLNIAYILAEYMEKYDENEMEGRMLLLANAVAQLTNDVPFDVIATMMVFKLYYGIHLKENGNIILKQ